MRLIKYFNAVILALGLLSCEDVIQVDLNSIDPAIVIEANVQNGTGNNFVKISKSTDFYNPGIYENISGATIKVSDNLGNEKLFSEISEGLYTSPTLNAISGRTYDINVNVEGRNYRASSKMPSEVLIDSVVTKKKNDGRPGDGANAKRFIFFVYFNDNPETENYYRLKIFKNNELIINNYILNDRLINGNLIELPVFLQEEDYPNNGDQIRTELLSIDKPTYEYFNTLQDVSTNGGNRGGMGVGSVSPANPITNWNNDALGYFSAYSLSSNSFIVNGL